MSLTPFRHTLPIPYKIIYLLLATTMAGLMAWAAFAWWMGPDLSIGWESLGRADQVLVPLERFRMGLFNLQAEASNYVLSQNYIGTDAQISMVPWYLLLSILGVSTVLVLSISTMLSRWWYYISMGMVVFGATFLHLEELQLFGLADSTGLIIFLVLVLPLSFYLQAFGTHTSLLKRMLFFGLAMTVFAGIIHFYSKVELPFATLAVNSFYIALLASLGTILLAAHEIPAAFLRITSGSMTGSGNSLPHFLILTVVYLGNLCLIYLHDTRGLDLGIYYINEFLFLPLTLILGFWGTQQREHIYQNITNFTEGTGLLYLCGTLITICLLGLSFHLAIDPAWEVFEDAIVFSHLGFGLGFAIYVLSNFSGAMTEGMAVYKAVYNPKYMPFATMRIGGAVVTLGLFLYAGSIGLNQSEAAFKISQGDLFMAKDNAMLAENYYATAKNLGYHNHRANYVLGSLARERGDSKMQLVHFRDATLKHPSPQAYINLARVYNNRGRSLDEGLNLRQALIDFPGNPYLLNNLGQYFLDEDKPDSAYRYLQLAAIASSEEKVPEANLYALLAKERIALDPDSLLNSAHHIDHPVVGANLYALANLSAHKLKLPIAPAGLSLPELDVRERAYLHNGLLNQARQDDSLFYDLLYGYDTLEANSGSQMSLEENLAYLAIGLGRTREANDWLRRLRQYHDLYQGLFSETLGFHTNDWGAPYQALQDFLRAVELGRREAILPAAILMARTESPARALEYLALQKDLGLILPAQQETINILLGQLQLDRTQLEAASDAERYQFLYLQGNSLPVDVLIAEIEELDNDDYKALAAAEHLLYRLDSDLREDAGLLYGLLGATNNAGEESLRMERLAMLAWLSAERNWEGVSSLLVDNEVPSYPLIQYGKLMKAITAVTAEDLDRAATTFINLGYSDPYFEQGVIEAARFMQEQAQDPGTSYDLLIRALQYNPWSVRLLKLHVLQAMRMNLPEYAAESLGTLEEILPSAEFKAFSELAQTVYAEAQESNNWE